MNELFNGLEISEDMKAALTERFNNETKGLISNKESILNEKRELESKYLKDTELLKSYKEKEEQLKDKELYEKGEFETLLNKKVSEKQKAFDEYKNSVSEREKEFGNKLSDLQKRIHKMQLKEQISKVALSDEHFDKTDTSVELLEMLALRSFETDENGSFKYKGEKLDKEGNQLNFKSWFDSEIKSNYSQLFKGKGGAGVGNNRALGDKHLDNSMLENMSVKEYKEAKKKGLI